jgi:hypothetical protein
MDSVAEREPGAFGRKTTGIVVDSPGCSTTTVPSWKRSPNIFASGPVIFVDLSVSAPDSAMFFTVSCLVDGSETVPSGNVSEVGVASG